MKIHVHVNLKCIYMYNSKITHSELYVQIIKHFTDMHSCLAHSSETMNSAQDVVIWSTKSYLIFFFKHILYTIFLFTRSGLPFQKSINGFTKLPLVLHMSTIQEYTAWGNGQWISSNDYIYMHVRYMRDIVWLLVQGEWMNKLVTTICW